MSAGDFADVTNSITLSVYDSRIQLRYGGTISGVKLGFSSRVPTTLTRQLTSEAIERRVFIALVPFGPLCFVCIDDFDAGGMGSG